VSQKNRARIISRDARATVECLHHSTSEFISPDLWPVTDST